MSTNLGYAGKLLTNAAGRVLSFGGTVTPPVILPTPDAPAITAENDAAQTITFTASVPLDQVRYEVAGAGPFTPTSYTIQLSPTTSYLPGAIVLYVAAIDGVRNESARAANQTTLAANVPPSNVTPPAPSLACDDTANTLTVSSPYPLADLEQRITDSGAVTALPALVTQVGDVARAEGYYQVRVKAASGRNASAWARSLAYTLAPVTPPSETWTVIEAESAAFPSVNGSGIDTGSIYRNGFGVYFSYVAPMRITRTFRYLEVFAPRTATGNLAPLVAKIISGTTTLASGTWNETGPPQDSGAPDGLTSQISLDAGATGTYIIELSSGATVVFDAIQIR